MEQSVASNLLDLSFLVDHTKIVQKICACLHEYDIAYWVIVNVVKHNNHVEKYLNISYTVSFYFIFSYHNNTNNVVKLTLKIGNKNDKICKKYYFVGMCFFSH
ncbi:uncharacterized protein LOC131642467 [Vicia villosa]|uniref:uncharacterized protein LOC131642467 n=1 Tax=Vicia villosa TaxID=3911 RepID=UPI00273B14D2|nr:uncharacterized protein LOC131642467 [Vicia villosa]